MLICTRTHVSYMVIRNIYQQCHTFSLFHPSSPHLLSNSTLHPDPLYAYLNDIRLTFRETLRNSCPDFYRPQGKK